MTLGLAAPDGHSERRYAGVVRGAIAALGARGVGLLASLVTVPLTIGYLGPERYGAWMAMLSVLGWLSIADLGVANHLTNALSSAFGRGDADGARRAVSTGFFVLSGVAAFLFAVGAAGWSLVSWGTAFNMRSAEAASEVGTAMLVALVLFCAGLPLLIIERVYLAQQRGAAANAWTAAGTVTSLIGVLVATHMRGGIVVLVAATMGATLVTKVVNAGWLFAHAHPELRPALAFVSRQEARSFVGKGSEFFLVQVAALVMFSTDNLVIAAVLGAREVSPYSVTWTLFALSNMLTQLSFPYLWSAYAEAMARGDGRWVLRTFRLSLAGTTVAAGLVLIPLTLFGRRIIELWAGSGAVPDAALIAWMATWNLIVAPAMSVSCFLNAAGRTRVQAWAGMIAAPTNILASVLLARRYGSAGVIAATVLTYLAFGVLPNVIAAMGEVNRLRAMPGSSGLTGAR